MIFKKILSKSFISKIILMIFLMLLTTFNLKLSLSVPLLGAGGKGCLGHGDLECEQRAERACNSFCAGAGGCEGVFWSGDSWCCPPGSGSCCSIWILICSNWPSWGRFTCIKESPGCDF